MPWDYASDKLNMKGSLSQIATKVKAIREQQDNVIFVDAGDTIQFKVILLKPLKINRQIL